MIPTPYFRGPLCATAHPDGCARHVQQQIDYVRSRPPLDGPRRVLIVGGSSGLGLAARITTAFGGGAETVCVTNGRNGSGSRTGTAGWYNTVAFERAAREAGLPTLTVVGDAFAEETKAYTAEVLAGLGPVDLVIYSVAASRRRDPRTGQVHRSVLKTLDAPFTDKALDFATGTVAPATLPVATPEEVAATRAVMGGDDWRRWLEVLGRARVLGPGARSLAFSYVGGQRLAPTYRRGTIGRAKDDLEATARDLAALLAGGGGTAQVAVMAAMVTQASAAIPMSSLYSVLLRRVMQERGLHEEPVEQMYRLFADVLYARSRYFRGSPRLDNEGRVRLDDRELRPDVQADVERRWAQVTTANLTDLGDPAGMRQAVHRLYGFGLEDVDYGRDVDPVRHLPGAVVVPLEQTHRQQPHHQQGKDLR